VEKIDVSDLPDDIARSLADQAEHHRRQLAKKQNGHVRPLPQWAGPAPAPEQLRRENLYDDE